MRFCFFGTYVVGEGYPINRVLEEGLVRGGHGVEVCRAEAWGDVVHRAFSPFRPLAALALGLRLGRAWWCLWRRHRRCQPADWTVVGYPGVFDVHLARCLGTRPLALVCFISLYDTVVADRERLGATSMLAGWLRRLDRAAFRAADVVLVDTEAQGDYYARLFDLPRTRFVRSFVGEDDARFSFHPAAPRRGGSLRVLFFGTYVPLHGIDTIIAAADLLRHDGDVHISLVGRGQLYTELQARATRLDVPVHFVAQWQSTADLVARIVDSHVCLGIFGTTAKAARVIPYKVFEAAAVGRAIITRDSPAIRELFDDGRSALLCPPGDGAALARAIRRLRDDDALRLQLSAAAHHVYRAHGRPRAVGRHLAEALQARSADPGSTSR